MYHHISKQRWQRGFTLLELSIVLVIIGLIVGGVLVGQDLIKAAEVRATVGQYEKFKTAVNTFRGKYGGIPGDLHYLQASQFGFFTFTGACFSGIGGVGCGDGNGLVQNSSGAAGVGEPLAFWRHLSDSSLIEGAYGTTGNALLTGAGATTGTVAPPGDSIPLLKLGGAMSFIAYGLSGINYFQALPIDNIVVGGYVAGGSIGLRPIDAYNIDLKIDDGRPNSGVVRATLGAPASTAAATWNSPATTGTCLTGGTAGTDTAATYNLGINTGANDPACSLSLRF